ncbi:hypothetical protein KGMB01110_05860 [Mediterraneibacter butyricigenes]|uniref:Uncharacterized protein n=1 Tax=Mediterraneibacter butyricigenes TaxID=2316025 RepID=A0A391NZW1_9FIRM|nr:hypothetical protein [Mediterraneibacter butyricigenes]GCA66150.1 hypothetical protein KGMB01110_05860 [Mediterraneibacter butyricigenes]
MKITFNDASELQVQSVEEQTDGALLIKVIQSSEEKLKEIFSDEFKTAKMIVSERMSTIGTYEKYQQFEAIVKYSAGIMGVVLYKAEETPAEKTERLETMVKELTETADDLKESNSALRTENEQLKKGISELQSSSDTLLGCVLEMSEVVYQ